MRDFTYCKRVVVKIGTNLLSSPEGVHVEFLTKVARDICVLRQKGLQVIVVTSGAVGMGARELGLNGKVSKINMRQACAAIGQPLLMQSYRSVFGKEGVKIAQLLLTPEVLNNRKSYLTLRDSLETLLSLRVLPIVNENDSVSTSEIGNAFGENDRLSALVASKIDADLLILMTDIDALYDADPRINRNAKPLEIVDELTPEILAAAGSAGSAHSTGGMRTKLDAVKIARRAGCRVVLAHGNNERVLERIIAGESLGTLFLARPRIKNRKRWILYSRPEGFLRIDEGAVRALREHRSLLPKGLSAVEGDFSTGAVVQVNDMAKIISNFSSAELQKLIGLHSSRITEILGKEAPAVIARPEETVFIDERDE
ncbi:glutamate 5-kinase [Marispirochaeta sp.]|jgi:glutamate 5-kinase|uniref:glutamate 5-kinase n=1 Tax=Marispirochaeta sp. TaxID=2038653 RepID=UPI0029C8C6FB|nr:glutamate 5-kinase [Marispirochaeta sp.]